MIRKNVIYLYNLLEGLVKLHDRFTFEKVIYADRFMLKNKEKSEAVRNKIVNLRDRKKQLEQSLKSFKEYRKGGDSIDQIIENSISFISN
jgi:citrate lyase synthetase